MALVVDSQAWGSSLCPSNSLGAFEGFPYLVTRLVPGFYHIALLPGSWPRDCLDALTRQQVAANRLQTCLALEAGVGIYFDPDGAVSQATLVPWMSLSISGRLHLAVACPLSAELAARTAQLARFEAAQKRTGYLLGDVSKGGRRATPEEALTLAGIQAGGIPKGLARCSTCREWRGSCLDPNPRFQGSIMRVWCRCDNDNRCARCGELFGIRKLNANYYNEEDGQIWHVPGFGALSHQCREALRKAG